MIAVRPSRDSHASRGVMASSSMRWCQHPGTRVEERPQHCFDRGRRIRVGQAPHEAGGVVEGLHLGDRSVDVGRCCLGAGGRVNTTQPLRGRYSLTALAARRGRHEAAVLADERAYCGKRPDDDRVGMTRLPARRRGHGRCGRATTMRWSPGSKRTVRSFAGLITTPKLCSRSRGVAAQAVADGDLVARAGGGDERCERHGFAERRVLRSRVCEKVGTGGIEELFEHRLQLRCFGELRHHLARKLVGDDELTGRELPCEHGIGFIEQLGDHRARCCTRGEVVTGLQGCEQRGASESAGDSAGSASTITWSQRRNAPRSAAL